MKRLLYLIVCMAMSLHIFSQSNTDLYTVPFDKLVPQPSIPILIEPLRLDSSITEIENKRVQKKQYESQKALKSQQKSGISTFSYYGDLHPHIPNSFAIDKSKDIGEIAFAANTSPTGTLSINLPIETIKDDKTFTPELSLAYGSQAGNGFVGFGWDIAGLSFIKTTDKSIYYDGKTSGRANATYDNAFSLDGMRLIKVSTSGTTVNFQSELGNIKVIGYGDGTYFTSFTVFYPNGNKAVYSNGTSASINHTFALSTITDLSGNTIRYTYDYIGNQFRIKKITFGKKEQASIEFAYTTSRSDPFFIYNAGIKTEHNELLSSITTKLNSEVLRTYTFSYTTKGYVSLLNYIYCSSGDKSFNPIRCYYGDNNQLAQFGKLIRNSLYT